MVALHAPRPLVSLHTIHPTAQTFVSPAWICPLCLPVPILPLVSTFPCPSRPSAPCPPRPHVLHVPPHPGFPCPHPLPGHAHHVTLSPSCPWLPRPRVHHTPEHHGGPQSSICPHSRCLHPHLPPALHLQADEAPRGAQPELASIVETAIPPSPFPQQDQQQQGGAHQGRDSETSTWAGATGRQGEVGGGVKMFTPCARTRVQGLRHRAAPPATALV